MLSVCHGWVVSRDSAAVLASVLRRRVHNAMKWMQKYLFLLMVAMLVLYPLLMLYLAVASLTMSWRLRTVKTMAPFKFGTVSSRLTLMRCVHFMLYYALSSKLTTVVFASVTSTLIV